MSIIHRFANSFLEEITYPSKTESWHVQGMLKNKSNQIFKFDVRGMSQVENEKLQKKGSTRSTADKMVFETDINWVIFDTLEINKYVIDRYNKKQSTKDILFEDLFNELDWNIVLPK